MARPSDEQIARWYPRLYRTALRMTGSAEEAADLTQEAFCRALAGWDRFDGRALPTTWLHRVLVNCVRNARRGPRRSGEPLEEWSLAADPSGRPPEQAERAEALRRLRRAMGGLPATLRGALVATALDGYTYREAAELLAVPVGTIASRVHEARKLLRAAMREAPPEPGP